MSGSYAVIVSNGICSDTSSCINVILTSIDETLVSKTNVNVYPNPAKNIVSIEMDRESVGDELVMYSIGGKIVKIIIINSTLQTIDLEDVDQGLYLIKYKNLIKKLVITK
jgi:hypothetical protein